MSDKTVQDLLNKSIKEDLSKIDKKTRKNKYTLTKNIVNAMLYTTKNTSENTTKWRKRK